MHAIGRLLLLLLLACDWAAETPFSPPMTSTECVWQRAEGGESARLACLPAPPTHSVLAATSLPPLASSLTEEPGRPHPSLIYTFMSLRR
jgi:hypothetical protein